MTGTATDLENTQTKNSTRKNRGSLEYWIRTKRLQIQKEKAKRKARRSFLNFVLYIWWQEWDFLIGTHTRKICYEVDDAIEAYEAGECTYLDVEVPYRHGKSDLISRALPAYFIGRFLAKNPDIVMTGYGNDLIEGFSQNVKDIIQSPAYQKLFPEVKLHPLRNKVKEWRLAGHSGIVTCTGLGGQIMGKGAHLCVTGGTLIMTDKGEIPISKIDLTSLPCYCLAYENGKLRWRKVQAVASRKADGIYRITSRTGRVVEATAEHPFYVAGEWVRADSLTAGDSLLLAVQKDVRASSSHNEQGNQKEAEGELLLEAVRLRPLQREARICCQVMFKLWRTLQEIKTVLFGEMQKSEVRITEEGAGSLEAEDGMSAVQQDIRAEVHQTDVLRKEMCQQSAQPCDARKQQPAFHRWSLCGQGKASQQQSLQKNPFRNIAERFIGMRSMRQQEEPAHAPHKQRPDRQQAGEPCDTLCELSPPTTRRRDCETAEDSVLMVEYICEPTLVWNLQVQGAENFFANGVLVHNCVVDDFLKSKESARSPAERNKMYNSITDVVTRLAPVHIVIICATSWHIDDPRQRIKKKMKEDPLFPRFKPLSYPAKVKDKDGKWTGEYLFEKWFGKKWYEMQYATQQSWASPLLDCNPMPPSGNLFVVDGIQIHEHESDFPDTTYMRGWDLASSEKERTGDDPDYTVGGLGTVTQDKFGFFHLWIKDCVWGQWEAPERDVKIKKAAKDDGAGVKVYVEAFGAYKDAYTTLKKVLSGHRIVNKSNLSGDKVAKNAALEPIFEAGHVHLMKGEWNDLFIEHYTAFPEGNHDDFCDMASIVYHESTKVGTFIMPIA